jgi:hypothetical protein
MKMSQQNGEKIYVNNEITTYMTDKKLLAFRDRLNPTIPLNYACIHAHGDEGENGRRVYSTIGILARDFSKGKGENNIKTEANISPAEARYIFARAQAGLGSYDGIIFASEKIFGQPNENGYSPVRKLTIGRIQAETDSKPRHSPWCVTIENGVGIKDHNSNGGSHCRKDSFVSQSKVGVFLTDQEFFCHLSKVVSFIDIWEITYGAKLIKEGHVALEVARAEHATENGYDLPIDTDNNCQGGYNNQGAGAYNNQPQAQPHQQQNQSTAQSQPGQQPNNGQSMTLEQARAVLIDMGIHKGKTLGQLESEKPKGVSWYVNSYTGKNELLRSGARVISEHIDYIAKHQKAS